MRRINLLRAHGSPTRYQYCRRGCRCVVCLGARAEAARKYQAEHPGERAERKRLYRAEHPMGAAESARKYRKEHREEIAEHKRKYTAEHREEAAARNRAAKARKRNATGTHTAADVQAQYERQHGRCFWRRVNPACAVSLKGGHHVDHVVPLAGERTSSNGPENIVLSCPQCNRSKHAKDPMDFAGVMF